MSHNSMTLPLQSTVVRVGKHSDLIVLVTFQTYPPKQHFQRARFWQISTAKLLVSFAAVIRVVTQDPPH